MSEFSVPSLKETRARLGIRRGTRLVPVLLLLLTIAIFVVYALPSGFQQLAVALGLINDAGEPVTSASLLQNLQQQTKDDKTLEAFMAAIAQRTHNWTVWDYVQNIARPLFKAFLEQLGHDFIAITRSGLTTLWQLGAYSLVPGIAGLVYRRSFWSWFLTSLVILMAINASGVFGHLTTAKVMPWSGSVFVFILSQIALLILAYRLRRHVQSGSFTLPARVHNWGLAAVLTFVGIACYFGWGPGYSSAPPSKRAGADAVFEWSTPAHAQDAAPRAADTPVTGAENKVGAGAGSVAKPDAAPATRQSAGPSIPGKTAAGPKRSWIWAFLGTGYAGWFYRWEFILIGLPLIYTLLRNSSNWTSRRNKNIVICLDGTSNTPDQLERGFAAQTNVYKLFKALKANKRGGFVPTGNFDASLCKKFQDKQIAFYYAGVGNKFDNDPILQTLGMATGLGVSEIIERAYLDLIRVYQPGDRVFITGFSRGAATARLLARTIDARGAPRAVWTLKLFGKHRTLWSSGERTPVSIDVLGCWDTVGSLGVAKTIAGINLQQLNMFKDLTVPDNVLQAYHMVALDEQRHEFEPTLMDPDPIRPERIVEVWFAGDHANIGGGWATDKLSDVTFDFLLRRTSSGYSWNETTEPGDETWGIYLAARQAEKAELPQRALSPMTDLVSVDPDPRGQVRHWFSNLYEYGPRTLPLHSVISDAVFERMTQSLPVYAPQALFDLNDALDEKRDLIDAKVAKLDETQSLKPGEREKIIEYKNNLKLRRWNEYWAELTSRRHGRFELPPQALDNVALARRPVAKSWLERRLRTPETTPLEAAILPKPSAA